MQIIPWPKNSQILQSPPTYSLMDKLFRQTSDLLMDFVILHKKNNPRM